MILYGKNFLIFDRLLDDINKYRHSLPYKVKSAYIPLGDDKLIAADIITEKGSLIERPTFLRLDSRWDEKKDNRKLNLFIQEGFNVMKIDVRGTGASLGKHILPWDRNEQEDLKQIINWISQQPWADGHIITFGKNYASTCSEMSAILNNESIRANIIFGNAYDLFSELFFPGGIFLKSFTVAWNQKMLNMGIKKIKPVKDPLYHPELSEIKSQHKGNTNFYDIFSHIQYSDDMFDLKPDQNIQNISVTTYSDIISRNFSPKFICGSWFDGKTATSTIHRFLNYSGPMICVIGPWDHNLRPIKPLIRKSPPFLQSELLLYLEYIRFAKKALSNPTGIPKLLYFYTIGEEKWKVTDEWPIPDMHDTKLFFDTKHRLSLSPCKYKGMKTEYHVNFNASSGKNTRWTSYFGHSIDYSNRGKQDRKLLTFTSPPFENSIEITGHPIVTLQMSSTHEDGSIFLYLEAVKRNKVIYLTEGQLHLLHWEETKKTPYITPIPYRSFKKSEASSLQSNIIYDMRIALEPLSVRLPANTKIRLAIGGADAENFKHYPETQKPSPFWSIYHNSEYKSFLQLPMKQISHDKNGT